MISIIIPTFNRYEDLKITLDSIFAQSYTCYEVIIVDNGPSTDDTHKYINHVMEERQNIVYISTRYQGVTYARSIGNIYAKGDIILQVDDDISMIDHDSLKTVNDIFTTYDNIDCLGLMELKNNDEIKIFKEISTYNNNHIVVKYPLKGIGSISQLYDLESGYENFIYMPRGIYRIESFRSCCMAYRRNVLEKLINWDCNYIKVGSIVGIREETDFLLRARNYKFGIYYTNLSAIHHRAGKRDKKVTNRNIGIKHYFYYAASHNYMVIKQLVGHKIYHIMLPWLIYQIFYGGYKNPGMYRAFKRGGIIGFIGNLSGAIYGIVCSIIMKRKYLSRESDLKIIEIFNENTNIY